MEQKLFNENTLNSMSDDMKDVLRNLLGNQETKKRYPKYKGKLDVTVWENTIQNGENKGDKYLSINIGSGKSTFNIPVFEYKENVNAKQ